MGIPIPIEIDPILIGPQAVFPSLDLPSGARVGVVYDVVGEKL